MTEETPSRTDRIVGTARRLLKRRDFKSLPEASIDAEFYFRFSAPYMRLRLGIITLVRRILGKYPHHALSEEDCTRIHVHLAEHWGLRVIVNPGPGRALYRFETPCGHGYLPLSPTLRAYRRGRPASPVGRLSRRVAYKTIRREGMDGTLGGCKRIRVPISYCDAGEGEVEIANEAILTSQLQAEVWRAGVMLGVLPTEGDSDALPPIQIHERLNHWIGWIFLQTGQAPSFIWLSIEYRGIDMNPDEWSVDQPLNRDLFGLRYVESSESQFPRSLRVRPWHAEELSANRRPARWSRVRVWSIYYASRRGGGTLSEEAAIERWNSELNDGVEPSAYRRQRDGILRSGIRF